MRNTRYAIIAGMALLSVACTDATQPDSALFLTDDFGTVPVGFNQTTSSFDGTGSALDGPFMPNQRGRHGGGGRGGEGLMGGGLGAGFTGEIGFGGGHHHGPGRGFGPFHPFAGGLNCTGTYDAASGRVTCATITDRGLTINRSIAYRDASGAAQSAFDSTTSNSINVRTTVTGTVTRRDSATATINHQSDRTIGGLAPGSTQRTVEGAARGQEDITGEVRDTAFTARRIVADTTRGLVIPLADGRPTYPTAGTVIRVMEVTVGLSGGSPATHSRREVITYDGSTTATVVITVDGTTKNCTLPLPRGRLVCE
jgi:hypothetical protein